MASSQYQTVCGLTPANVAREAREKYWSLRNTEPKIAWGNLDASTQNRWIDAVESLFVKCERQMSLSAASATAGFVDGILGRGAFEKLPPANRLLWEAVLRHAVMLIMAGEPGATRNELDQEIAEAREYDWGKWLEKKAMETNLQETVNAK